MGDTEHESTGTNNTEQSQQQPSTMDKLLNHVNTNRVECALWATRMLTIFFGLTYIIPIFGFSASAYNKVLLANAATNALRLHQRLPEFQFSRAYLSQLFVEDSCHYLIFSFIFMNAQPVLIILLPVLLFAVLHASSYGYKLLDSMGQNSFWIARFLISIIELQTSNILRACAFCEIFIMPLVIVLVFAGKASFMTPFMYYHFLVMRYMSRRNPYTRNMFTELRMTCDYYVVNSLPQPLAKVVRLCIQFITRLAPQTQPAAAQ